jgi:hypothetical protein
METAPSLLEELQRRRVFRAVIAYGVAAFGALQIIEPVMHAYRWPEEVPGRCTTKIRQCSGGFSW